MKNQGVINNTQPSDHTKEEGIDGDLLRLLTTQQGCRINDKNNTRINEVVVCYNICGELDFMLKVVRKT